MIQENTETFPPFFFDVIWLATEEFQGICIKVLNFSTQIKCFFAVKSLEKWLNNSTCVSCWHLSNMMFLLTNQLQFLPMETWNLKLIEFIQTKKEQFSFTYWNVQWNSSLVPDETVVLNNN